jgi:hypothetical protein
MLWHGRAAMRIAVSSEATTEGMWNEASNP